MDALERLTAFLRAQPGTEGMDAWHAEWAEALLRQHAHELAEKIRAAPFAGHLLPAHHKRRAAAIIDPEVTK